MAEGAGTRTAGDLGNAETEQDSRDRQDTAGHAEEEPGTPGDGQRTAADLGDGPMAGEDARGGPGTPRTYARRWLFLLVISLLSCSNATVWARRGRERPVLAWPCSPACGTHSVAPAPG